MRKLAAVAVFILGAAAIMGAGRGGTYQGGSYATSGASYQAGGAPAGWDTVLVVLTMDEALNHDLATYDAAVAAANAAGNVAKGGGVFQFGVDDTTFAYAVVDTYHTGVGYWPTSPNNHDRIYLRGSGYNAATKWAFNDTTYSPRPYLLRFDPLAATSAAIPLRSTIVSATLHMMPLSWGAAAADTVVSTLMTNPNDNIWYHQTSIFDHATTYAFSSDRTLYMAKCSYTYQWYATNTGTHYGYANGSNSNAPTSQWSPALSTRSKFSDWGSVTDWTGLGTLTASNAEVVVNITDCVQGIANGLTNNGIMMMMTDTNTFDRAQAFYEWEPRAGNAALTKRPWIQIKYITKRYATPMPGGKRWAFVFQTDDAKLAYNDTLMNIFTDATPDYPSGRPGKLTVFAVKRYTDNGDGAPIAKLIAWHDRGAEISHHSLNHWPRGNKYLNVFAIQDTAHASLDSLRIEMNPSWLDDYADAASRSDLRDSQRWGNAMAMPGNLWSPFTVYVGAEKGLKAIRVGEASNSGDLYYAVAPLRPTMTDTSFTNTISSRFRSPRNMMVFSNSLDINTIVGGKANAGANADSVKTNMRRYVRQILAQDRGLVGIYTHDFKTGPYANDGAEASEIRAMLQVVDELGGEYMTISEYTDWVRSGSTAVATPVGYAQPDTFRFDAADAVWYKPNGVDNRWIRGVR